MPCRPTTTATLLTGAALGIAATVPFIATAQPDKPATPSLEEAMQMDPDAIMKMMMQMAQPDDHHKVFERFAGTFDMTAKFWMEPGAEPEVSKGTCTGKIIMDGRYLVCDVDMTLNFGGMKVPMTGMSVMAYSRPAGEYQSIWIDTMNTNMTVQRGHMEGGKLTVAGETATPFGPSKLKNVYIMQPDGYDLEFHEPNPMTGEMMKTGVIEYRSKVG